MRPRGRAGRLRFVRTTFAQLILAAGLVVAAFLGPAVWNRSEDAQGAGGIRGSRGSPSNRPSAVVSTPSPATRTYVAKPGDTLRSIAGRFYGDENAWPAIWRANRDIVPRPTDLMPGMELVIPPR